MEITITGAREVDVDMANAPKRVQRAAVRALNRAVNSGRTLMVRLIAHDTGLRSKDVRDAMKVQEATQGRPEAKLATSLKRIPLIKFGARGPEPSRGRGRGVSYRVKGSGTQRLPHAFIATVGAGHRGVFERKGKKRLPIRELFGPSLGRVFAKFRPEGTAQMVEAFKKNFAHEFEFEQSRGGTD